MFHQLCLSIIYPIKKLSQPASAVDAPSNQRGETATFILGLQALVATVRQPMILVLVCPL